VGTLGWPVKKVPVDFSYNTEMGKKIISFMAIDPCSARGCPGKKGKTRILGVQGRVCGRCTKICPGVKRGHMIKGKKGIVGDGI